MNLEFEIFKGKSFGNLLEEIYNNQKKKDKQIAGLIGELRPLISDMSEATMIVPLIKEYMDLGIKNDDQLLKMATIIQRIAANTTSEGSFSISDSERAEILKEVEALEKAKTKK
jgi:hypothetical protein